jgi:bacillithiol system protein YtxJ
VRPRAKVAQPPTPNISDNTNCNHQRAQVFFFLDNMNWITLNSEEQLQTIKEKSATVPQVIFKHSTRCGTSSMVLNRLERNTPPQTADFYFLDLIAHRSLSNKIAETFHVYHESPQILVIKNGECIYDESHMGITMDEITEQVAPS